MNKESLTSTTTIGAAILTALLPLACCWGPTLLAGIAVLSGVASEMAWLHPYEPYLYAISFSALGYSHYNANKRDSPDNENCDNCATDNVLTSTTYKSTKLVLWLATGLVAIMFLLNQFPQWFV